MILSEQSMISERKVRRIKLKIQKIMKFNFKIQAYQTEAVENTVAVFAGQPSYDVTRYRRDMGRNYQRKKTVAE